MDTYWLEGHDSGSTNEKHCLRPHLTGGSVAICRHTNLRIVSYIRDVCTGMKLQIHTMRGHFSSMKLLSWTKILHLHREGNDPEHPEQSVRKRCAVRMRSGFFPFVERDLRSTWSVRYAAEKLQCMQHVGWIEVMPGGSPHPNVLRAAGLDPDEYTGFYVNIGLDRLVMMRYGVTM